MFHEHVSIAMYRWLESMYATLYLAWGATWGLVAWHYGRAAYMSWLSVQGRWRDVPGEVAKAYVWAFRETLCKLGIVRGPSCGMPLVGKYTPGHILRFSIFLGSLMPMAFGFLFFNLDRSTWPPSAFVIISAMILLSLMSAMGHMYLALRPRMNRWRWLVLVSFCWLTVTPFVFHFLL